MKKAFQVDPEFLGEIIDLFDDFLEERGIRIPSSDKEMKAAGETEESAARIYGTDYDALSEHLTSLITDWADQKYAIKPFINENGTKVDPDRWIPCTEQLPPTDHGELWLTIQLADDLGKQRYVDMGVPDDWTIQNLYNRHRPHVTAWKLPEQKPAPYPIV